MISFIPFQGDSPKIPFNEKSNVLKFNNVYKKTNIYDTELISLGKLISIYKYFL